MEVSVKTLVATATVLIISGAVGDHLLFQKNDTVKVVDESRKEASITESHRDDFSHEHVRESIAPDGTRIVDTDRSRNTVEDTIVRERHTDDVHTQQSVTAVRPRNHVALLAATDLHDFTQVNYGLYASREVLGPITVGVFGLTNGTIGASVGISF